MIIVRLIGGLGNQMFQYAASRRLALMRNVQLKFDTGWFNSMPTGDTARRFALGVFAIAENFATEEEIRFITGAGKSKLRNLLNGLIEKSGLTWPNHSIIREKGLHFNHTLMSAPDNVYLLGYWQSEKYFLDVENVIRQEFTIKYPLDGENLKVAELIRNSCSVSIHIRRGDYVSNPDTTKFHGLCGLDYYQRCILDLIGKVSHPHFFVFSDDPEWTREHIKIDFPLTIVDHNDSSKGYEDIRLMSLCSHNIIANSSFSWWGAWLNPNPSKLVYAPHRWFNRTDIDTRDLIPSTWVRL